MITGTLYPDALIPYDPDQSIKYTDYTQAIDQYNGVDAYWIGHIVPPIFLNYTTAQFDWDAGAGTGTLTMNVEHKDEDVPFTWGAMPNNSLEGWASIGSAQNNVTHTPLSAYDFRLFNALDCGRVFQYCPLISIRVGWTCYDDDTDSVITGDITQIDQFGGAGNSTLELFESLQSSTSKTYNLKVNGVIFPITYSYADLSEGPFEISVTVGNNTLHGYVYLWAIWVQGGRDLSTAYDWTTQSGGYAHAFPIVREGDYLLGTDFNPWDAPMRCRLDGYGVPELINGVNLGHQMYPVGHYYGGYDGVEIDLYDPDYNKFGMVMLNGNCIIYVRGAHDFEIHPTMTFADIKKYCMMFPSMEGIGSPKYSGDYEPIEDEWSDDPEELSPWQSDITENVYDGEVPEPEPEPGGSVIIDGDLIVTDNTPDAHGTEPNSDFRTTNLRCMNQFITMDASGFDALKNKLAESAQSPDVNSFWSKLGPKMFKNDNGNFVLDEVTTETSNNIGSYIVSARVYPFTITGVCPVDSTLKTDIAFGYQGAVLSGVAHYNVTTPYGVIDAGTIPVPTFAQSVGWNAVGTQITFLDETPYTKTRIVLPAIGSFELNPQMVVGHSINIKYGVDLTNGICTAIVTSTKTGGGSDGGTRLLLCKSAKIAYDLTMSGNNLTAQSDNIAVSTLQKQQQSINTARMQLGVAKDVATTASQLYSNSKSPVNLMVQSGHAMERIVENMFNIASTSIAEMKVNIDGVIASRDVPQTITHGSSDAGIAGQVAPYIVVQRPRIDNIYNSALFKNTYGHIANYIGKLESGYNEVVNPRVDIEGATENELAHINSMLRSGVYVR